ncbi:complement component C8 gamma chain [Vipera latastei]
MAPIAVLLLAGLLLASPSWARRPKPPNSPIDNISAQERFDPAQGSSRYPRLQALNPDPLIEQCLLGHSLSLLFAQLHSPCQTLDKDSHSAKEAAPLIRGTHAFAGKWFLVGVASDCLYLRENGYRVEATNVVVSVADSGLLLFSTFRPLEGICWNIKQSYFAGKTPGRYLLKGRAVPVDVVVGDTDYSSYAILYFQKNRKISAKLYGRTAEVANDALKKFEAAMTAIGISDDYIFYYPVYGFCSTADQFHILDGELPASVPPRRSLQAQDLNTRPETGGLCFPRWLIGNEYKGLLGGCRRASSGLSGADPPTPLYFPFLLSRNEIHGIAGVISGPTLHLCQDGLCGHSRNRNYQPFPSLCSHENKTRRPNLTLLIFAKKGY